MTLWMKLVESIFKKRRQARQEKMDTWLTQTTPRKMWKDKLKNVEKVSNSTMGGKGFRDPRRG